MIAGHAAGSFVWSIAAVTSGVAVVCAAHATTCCAETAMCGNASHATYQTQTPKTYQPQTMRLDFVPRWLELA
jgi:hypothetical protein